MSPSAIIGRGENQLKKHGWVMIAAVVLIGAWLSLSTMPSTGADEVAHGPATEQSLFSLDSSANPNGAPGSLADLARAASDEEGGAGEAAGYTAHPRSTQGSSLWSAPEGYSMAGSASGSPISEDLAKDLEDAAKDGPNSSKYAAAMAKVANQTKAPDNSWGAKSARSGFKKPKLNAGKVGLSRSRGGGSRTKASLKITKAFGLGGKTGLKPGTASFSPGRISSGGRIAKRAVQNNRSLEGLRGARKRGLDSLKGGDEVAASGGRKTFDASGSSGGTALQQLGTSAGITMGAGTPTNLKETSASINQKKIEVPEVKGEEAKDDGSEASKKYMKQQMMMMIAMMAISGIMGPITGGIGSAIAAGMGFGGPSGGGPSGMTSDNP